MVQEPGTSRTNGAQTPSGDELEQATTESRRKRLSTATLVTLVGAILAALISATNLSFELWPGLKPDPKEKLGADLAILTLDKNVTHGRYCDRLGESAVACKNPKASGNVFYLRAQIEGFKRESLNVSWFTYGDNGRRLPGGPQKRSASEDVIFEPRAPINTQVAQVWVEDPNESGRFFVRFELYSHGVLLAFVDSGRFKVQNVPTF
jgi:homospermidine synthase